MKVSKLTNLFQLLEVEEPTDSADVLSHLYNGQPQSSTSSSNASAKRSPTGPPIKASKVYVDDICMQIYCFFNDLHELRRQVKCIWQSYKEGKLELIPASMASNGAIALVEQMEKELLDPLPDANELIIAFGISKFNVANPYTAIIGLLSRVVTGSEVLDPSVACTELGTFWFAMAFILAKLGMAYQMRGENQKRMKEYTTSDPSAMVLNLASKGWRPWPRTYTSRAQAMFASKVGEETVVDPEFARIERLDSLLSPILMDTILYQERLETDPSFDQPRVKAVDELTRAITKLEQVSLTTTVTSPPASLPTFTIC